MTADMEEFKEAFVKTCFNVSKIKVNGLTLDRYMVSDFLYIAYNLEFNATLNELSVKEIFDCLSVPVDYKWFAGLDVNLETNAFTRVPLGLEIMVDLENRNNIPLAQLYSELLIKWINILDNYIGDKKFGEEEYDKIVAQGVHWLMVLSIKRYCYSHLRNNSKFNNDGDAIYDAVYPMVDAFYTESGVRQAFINRKRDLLAIYM